MGEKEKKKSTKQKAEPVCSFCGKEATDENPLIKGKGNSFICYECIIEGKALLEENMEEEHESEKMKISDYKPSTVKNFLDEYIIGQDYAKEALSTAIYNHYKMLQYKSLPESKQKVEMNKSNILLLGNTGSGKTYILQTLSKILDVPLAIVDSTTLTEAGLKTF